MKRFSVSSNALSSSLKFAHKKDENVRKKGKKDQSVSDTELNMTMHL